MALGVTNFVSFGALWLVRRWVQARLIIAARPERQVRRQFAMEICLCLCVGVALVCLNRFLHGVPLVYGGSVLIGCGILGFFISLDMALARERGLIHQSHSDSASKLPPQRLYPMTRKFSLVAFASALFVVIVLALAVARDFSWLAEVGRTADSLAQAQRSVMVEIVFIMAVLLGLLANLIFSYAKNLHLLFNIEIRVLEEVSNGNLDETVPVVTSDEFGFIASHTNTMIHGLRHRSRLMTSLKLAEEVQQNLIPRRAPTCSGMDIFGFSSYCDQTGGDYYDFFSFQGNRLGVVVADAADHGIGSALYMTTARALLRYGARHYREPDDFISQTNHYLSIDSGDTGRFMALFFLEFDMDRHSLRWVRAGHDPAFVYDPVQKRFSELTGEGIAMGIDEDYRYISYERTGWDPGTIVAIGTDGIREARNASGEVFGKARLLSAIEKCKEQSARQIQRGVFGALEEFLDGDPLEDDVTLVVIKLLDGRM